MVGTICWLSGTAENRCCSEIQMVVRFVRVSLGTLAGVPA